MNLHWNHDPIDDPAWNADIITGDFSALEWEVYQMLTDADKPVSVYIDSLFIHGYLGEHGVTVDRIFQRETEITSNGNWLEKAIWDAVQLAGASYDSPLSEAAREYLEG